jgi:hypothetical protein
MAETPAGWYPDHYNPERERYWNGTQWTDDYRPRAAPPSPEAAPGGWGAAVTAPPEFTRPCPFCAELVKGTAVVCRHCGRDLGGGGAPAPNGLAVAALVLGIIGAVSGLVPLFFWLAFILGVLALIFGLVARQRVVRRKMATWGAVLGGVSLVLSVIGLVIIVTVFDDTSEEIDQIFACAEEEIETGTTSPDCNE